MRAITDEEMMSKSYRKISVGGADYEYKVGSSHVDIRPPEGKRLTPTLPEVMGLTWDEIERGKNKRYFSVTPRHVKEYIERAFVAKVF